MHAAHAWSIAFLFSTFHPEVDPMLLSADGLTPRPASQLLKPMQQRKGARYSKFPEFISCKFTRITRIVSITFFFGPDMPINISALI